MRKPKVSVVVPVYNTERYLTKCLDSLVNQTLREIEIVVVDDGSKDSSSQLIAEYYGKYPDKLVVLSQENSGQAVARNKALKVCSGEYIGFLDSDDFVDTSMFEKMYNAAVSDNADYVACGYTDITYEGEKIVELQHYVASKVARTTKDLYFGALVSPFIHLYRRDLVASSNVTFPEGVIYEDTAFYLNLVPHIKRIAVIEEPLAYRVRHRNSTTTIFKAEKVGQIFSVIDGILKYYNENKLWDEYKNEVTYFCVKVLLCSSMQRICKVNYENERKQLVKKTIEYLEKKFPEYRRNPYFKKGLQNLYIRSFNGITAGIYTGLIRLKGKTERQYS